MRIFLVSIAVGLSLATAVASAASDRSAATKGAAWLLRADPEAGGNAADAVVALRAAGSLSDAEARRRASVLRSGAAAYANGPGAAAKTILGLAAAGQGNPRCAGSIDLLARMLNENETG